VTKAKPRQQPPRSAAAAPAGAPKTHPALHAAWGAAGLLLLVALVYAPTLANGFVSDDTFYVQVNQQLNSAAGLRDIWLKPGATVQYYPLVHTLLWLQYQAWELTPRWYHLVNLLAHAGVAVLLWRVLARLAVPAAWLVAAAFAVHPVQVETVAWISEQKNLFSAALALGAILAWLRFDPLLVAQPDGDSGAGVPGNHWLAYAVALALFVASLLCKTVTATLPAVLLVLIWWKRGQVTWRDVARLLPFFAIGLALSWVTVWMEQTTVGARGAAWELSPLARVLIAGRAVWFYAGKLVWPHPLAFTYPRWIIDTHAAWQYVYPVGALAVVGLLWALRGRVGRGPLAAALIFGGVLTPALGFFDVYPFLFSFVADHYVYHASMAGIALIIAGVLLAARRFVPRLSFESIGGNPAAWGLAAALLAPLAIVAHRETYAYHDEESLIVDAIQAMPSSWAAQFRYAGLLINQRQYEQALEHYREALRLFPTHNPLNLSLGTTLASLQQHEAAIAAFQTALAGRLDADDRRAAYFHVGNELSALRRYEEAIQNYRAAIELDPNAAQARFNLALALREQGQLPAAAEQLRALLERHPEAAEAQHALGVVLRDQGQADAALQALAEAVRLAPDRAPFLVDLALSEMQSQKWPAAADHLRAAIAAESQNANAHSLLGIVLGQQGDLSGAIGAFRAALQIQPDHAGAAENLQKALAAQRQAGEKAQP